MSNRSFTPPGLAPWTGLNSQQLALFNWHFSTWFSAHFSLQVPAAQPASQQAAATPKQEGASACLTQVPIAEVAEVASAGCGAHRETQPEAATSAAAAVASDTSAETHIAAPLPPSEAADTTHSIPLTLADSLTETTNISVPSQQPANAAHTTAHTAPTPATATAPAVRQPHMALNQQTNSAVKAHASHLRALAQLGVVPAAAGAAAAAPAANSAADAAAAAAADRRSERQRHKKTQDEELANAASALMQVT